MIYENLSQRQPRSGTRQNHARAVYNSSTGRYDVQLINLSVEATTYGTAISVESLERASAIAERLNKIFTDGRADLDFVTPGYSNGCYVVLWSGTTWLGKDVYVQRTGCGDTYENLYRGCKLPNIDDDYYEYSDGSPTIIATVTLPDVNSYGKKE